MPQRSPERTQVILTALPHPEQRHKPATSPLSGASHCLETCINRPKQSILTLLKLTLEWRSKEGLRPLPNRRLLNCELYLCLQVSPRAPGHQPWSCRCHHSAATQSPCLQVSPRARGHEPVPRPVKRWLAAAASLNSQNHGTLFIINSD